MPGMRRWQRAQDSPRRVWPQDYPYQVVRNITVAARFTNLACAADTVVYLGEDYRVVHAVTDEVWDFRVCQRISAGLMPGVVALHDGRGAGAKR